MVDATGDCDIANFAGVPTENFNQGNVLAVWYYSVGREGYKLNTIGAADVPIEERNTDNGVELLTARRFSGLDGKELSELMCMTHQYTYAEFLKKRKNDDSFLPVTIATTPQIRMTRRIV